MDKAMGKAKDRVADSAVDAAIKFFIALFLNSVLAHHWIPPVAAVDPADTGQPD